MSGPPSTRYAREPSYAGCSSAEKPNIVLNRGRSGSKSLASMMPPEYCHSCKGDGVCADATCEKQPQRSSARKYCGSEQARSDISISRLLEDYDYRGDTAPDEVSASGISCRCTLRPV